MSLTNVWLFLFSWLTSLFFPILNSHPRSEKKSMFYHLSNWYHIIATNEIPLSANTCPRTNTSQCVERKTSLVGQMVFIQEGILEDKRILTRDFFIIHFFFLPSVISFLWIFRREHKNVTWTLLKSKIWLL